jgi:hypothetical protein
LFCLSLAILATQQAIQDHPLLELGVQSKALRGHFIPQRFSVCDECDGIGNLSWQ